MTDRRTYFFLVAGVAVLLVQPIVPQYRWLTITVGSVYFVFAALFAAAHASARHGRPNDSSERRTVDQKTRDD